MRFRIYNLEKFEEFNGIISYLLTNFIYITKKFNKINFPLILNK